MRGESNDWRHPRVHSENDRRRSYSYCHATLGADCVRTVYPSWFYLDQWFMVRTREARLCDSYEEVARLGAVRFPMKSKNEFNNLYRKKKIAKGIQKD
jgi:hypothetical protein